MTSNAVPASHPMPEEIAELAEESGGRRTLPTWLLVGGAWAVYGVALALLYRPGGRGMEHALPVSMGQAALWWLLTPSIIWLARHATRERIGLLSTIAVHGVAALVAAFMVSALRFALFELLWPAPARSLLYTYVFWLDVHVVIYLTVVIIALTLDLHRRYCDGIARTHLLELQLSRAQMQFLELQLQPHFLFNCLNSVSELAHEAPEAAERMLRQLRALLRVSLERAGQDEVTLDDELAGLAPYIEIQKTRFSDWLTVEQHIDPAARDALVPHLILQPLVENAIRHGLAVRSGPGRVVISARVHGDMLSLSVRDDGVGLAPTRTAKRPGIGLRNTRDRLRQLYDPDYRFVLRAAPEGGTIVELDVPLRRRGALIAARIERDRDRLERADRQPQALELAQMHAEAMRLEAIRALAAASAEGERTSLELPFDDPMLAVDVPFSAEGGAGLVTGGWASVRLPDRAPVAPELEPEEATIDPSPKLSLRHWMWICVGWLALGLFWTQQVALLGRIDATRGETLTQDLVLNLTSAGVWAALTPLALFLARRVRITREHFGSRLALHFAIALVIGVVQVSLSVMLMIGPGALVRLSPLTSLGMNQLVANIFIYFGLLAWSHARDFYAWYRERELAGLGIEAEIARSRYQALCVRLRPHIVLGTLELLTRLVHEDVPRAERLITRLADVLRMTLDSAADATTSLRKELDILRSYIEVLELGIRPGLRLVTRVPAELLTAALPNRLLRKLTDDILATFPGDARVDVMVDAEHGDGAVRIRVHAEAAAASPGLRAAQWPERVETAALAESDHSVSLTFPDARTAIVVLSDVRPDGARAPEGALAARPA